MDLPVTDNFKVPNSDTLVSLIISRVYAMQEKKDGRRLVVVKTEHGIIGYNKLYEAIDIPSWLYRAMESLPQHPWCFDGELCEDGYYIFDLVSAPSGRTDGKRFDERMLMLSALVNTWDVEKIFAVSTCYNPKEKFTSILNLRNSGAEGVVFRPLGYRSVTNGPKFHGVLYKYKFYKTVDAIVLKKRVDGKRTVELGLFEDSYIKSIGNCKIDYDMQDKMVAVDQVVEVKYRKLSVNRRLVEPSFIRIRNDKPAYRCTTEQFGSSNWTPQAADGIVTQIRWALGVDEDAARKVYEMINEAPVVGSTT